MEASPATGAMAEAFRTEDAMKTISRQSLVITIIGFGLALGSATTAGGGGWPEHQLLFADEVGDTDHFGWAVTTDGATALTLSGSRIPSRRSLSSRR